MNGDTKEIKDMKQKKIQQKLIELCSGIPVMG
jgi:hypothetical protein